ncbi:hypothetical protein ACFW3D_31935 [Streptomyces sp. NPDC058864]
MSNTPAWGPQQQVPGQQPAWGPQQVPGQQPGWGVQPPVPPAPKKGGKGKWIAGGIAGFVILGAIASNNSEDTSSAKPDKPAAVKPTSKAAVPKSPEAPSVPSVPKPNTAQAKALIATLYNIEPGLAAKEDRAVSRSRNVCLDILNGQSNDKVASNAEDRFEGGTVSTLSKKQVAQIVSAVKATFCGPTGKGAPKNPVAPKRRTTVDRFRDYVAEHGSVNEAAMAKHVTKIQGGDDINNVLDTADVYTDFSGDFSNMPKAKLIASAFADWQESRGKSSKNGLVTVYSSGGDVLGNNKF